MSFVEIFQLIFLLAVFAVGIIGFIKVATSDDDQKD